MIYFFVPSFIVHCSSFLHCSFIVHSLIHSFIRLLSSFSTVGQGRAGDAARAGSGRPARGDEAAPRHLAAARDHLKNVHGSGLLHDCLAALRDASFLRSSRLAVQFRAESGFGSGVTAGFYSRLAREFRCRAVNLNRPRVGIIAPRASRQRRQRSSPGGRKSSAVVVVVGWGRRRRRGLHRRRR